jgi:hypothetical protein
VLYFLLMPKKKLSISTQALVGYPIRKSTVLWVVQNGILREPMADHGMFDNPQQLSRPLELWQKPLSSDEDYRNCKRR